MWDSFKISWDLLAAAGLISESERTAISFPSYYRSLSEVSSGAAAVEGIKVVSVEEKVRSGKERTQWLRRARFQNARSPIPILPA